MATITLKTKIMKTYISITVLLLFACSSNKQNQSDISNCDFNYKISENDKIVNVKGYVEGQGGWTITNNDSIEIRIVPDSDGWRKYTINKKSNIENHILYHEISLNVINSFSFYNKGYFNIGNEYIYNEQGQVIKTIDHNQYDKYPVCYKEIIKTVLKKAGDKYFLHALYRDSILTEENTNQYKYTWNVHLDKVERKTDDIKNNSYRVDAKTGNIIKEWESSITAD